MKHSFIGAFTFAPATIETGNATVATPPPAKVYSSDKLTELKNAKKEAWEKFQKQEFDTPAWHEAQLDVYKIGKQIDGEIALLKKAELDAEIAEKRNVRIALVDNYDTAVLALSGLPKNATQEAKDAATTAVKAAREIIVNELLARYATSKPATATNGTPTNATAGGRGATGEEIKSKLLAYIAAGKTNTDAVKSVIAEGFSRGTTGAVMTAMKKAGEVAAD